MPISSACLVYATSADVGRFLQAYGSACGEFLTGIAAVCAAIGGLWQYSKNRKLERIKWLDSLYRRFYDEPTHKRIRRILDKENQTKEIETLVQEQPEELTDYLNFFEFIAYLDTTGQLKKQEISAVFDYYLGILKRHASVRRYICDIRKNGYEQLCKLLALEAEID